MSLPFHPKPGTIVTCNYDAGGFRQPEMTKLRLAVVISPKLKRRNDLVTVVPLSKSEPEVMQSWHVPVEIDIPGKWGAIPRWAKCDMVNTVAYARLNLPHYRHPVTQARLYHQEQLSDALIEQLRSAMRDALGMR